MSDLARRPATPLSSHGALEKQTSFRTPLLNIGSLPDSAELGQNPYNSDDDVLSDNGTGNTEATTTTDAPTKKVSMAQYSGASSAQYSGAASSNYTHISYVANNNRYFPNGTKFWLILMTLSTICNITALQLGLNNIRDFPEVHLLLGFSLFLTAVLVFHAGLTVWQVITLTESRFAGQDVYVTAFIIGVEACNCLTVADLVVIAGMYVTLWHFSATYLWFSCMPYDLRSFHTERVRVMQWTLANLSNILWPQQ